MLNLVPFAGPRRKMADRDGETKFIGETLKLPFPQTQPRTIAPPRICRDQQPLRAGIKPLTLETPPAPDRSDREGGGVPWRQRPLLRRVGSAIRRPAGRVGREADWKTSRELLGADDGPRRQVNVRSLT